MCIRDSLQAIQKQAASEQRWRDHFALQKQRFALEAERFKLAQERSHPSPTADPGMSEAEVIRRAEAFDRQTKELPVETLNGQRIIRQTISVATVDGKVVTKFEPSNTEVADSCENSAMRYYEALNAGNTSALPPPDVCRLFKFAGPVPAEYHWLLPDEADPALPNIKVIALLSLDTWWEVFAAERERPTKAYCHNGPEAQEVKKAA